MAAGSSRYPDWELRPQIPGALLLLPTITNFVEFVSSAKCVLLPSEKDKITALCSAFASSAPLQPFLLQTL